jgi:hypothetical protein
VCAALATVAGCGGHGEKARPANSTDACLAPCMSPTPTPTRPAGVVTLQQAGDLLARYVKINNQANATAGTSAKSVAQAQALNDQIEAGPLRAQSRGEFAIYKVRTAEDRKYDREAFSYVGTTWYIPRADAFGAGQQPFFAALSHVKDGLENKSAKRARLIVFGKQPDASWKLTAVVDLDGRVPALAHDAQGYALPLAPDAGGLAMQPAHLALAIGDNYTTGGLNDGAALAATTDAKVQRGLVESWTKPIAPVGKSEVAVAQDPYQAVYALKTADGGALTVVSDAHEMHDFVLALGGTITISAHHEARAWVPGTVTDLTVSYGCLDAAVIPRTGKTVQIGMDCLMEHASAR